jgi:hypothetical protein
MSSTSIRTIRVRAAAPGLRVPHERHPRKYITGDGTVVVPATAYYLRRISDGELVEVEVEVDDAPPAAAGKANKPKSKEA